MKKRLIRVCAVMSLMAGMYLYAQKAETVGGWQEDLTQGSEEYSGMQATLKTESESMDPKSINPEISMGILTDSNIVDIGNHVVAYRIPAEKIHTIWSLSEIFQGDYIVLFDLDRERRMYIPDTYGTILDIGVEPGGVNLRYVRGEDGEERQTCIPITFNPQEGDMLEYADYHFRDDRVVAPTQELDAAAFPVKVWSETFEWKGEIFETVFERTSPVYDLQLEEGGLFADYCLTVRDGKGDVISSQSVVNFPIDYEEVYWFTDFSGDGVPDVAVCHGLFLGKNSWSYLSLWIWDGEGGSYQRKSLPKGAPSTPLWDAEQSVLISCHEKDEEGYTIINMYSYMNDQWVLVKSRIPLYGENLWYDEEKNIRMPDSYKVEDYVDGEVVREEVVAWADDIWNPGNERYCRLYPGTTPEWEKVSVMFGEMPVDKYVRTEAEIEDFYGYYRITEFWPTIYYSAREFDVLPIQEADMMIGRVIEIQEDILKTYASMRRLGTREGRSAFAGNYNIETIYIEDPEYQWNSLTPDVAWYEDYDGGKSMIKEYYNAIRGSITINITTPFGQQKYLVMDEGIIMEDSLSNQFFFLEKLDAEPAGNNSTSYLSEEDRESVMHGLYGTYTIEEFLPTKFFPAKDSSGEIRLPQEEANMMIGQEIRIGEGNFITYDNFRLPNSKIVGRAMDEFLLEEVDISDPDYQVTVKQRDEIYGLRDDMLPEDMAQEEYIEVNVYPGYYTNSERNLPQLYLLEDGRIIMYAMGEYFLLQKSD